jgi:hypothetical protein
MLTLSFRHSDSYFPLNIIIIKNKIYHTVETIPKSNIKIVERCKIDTPMAKRKSTNGQTMIYKTYT